MSEIKRISNFLLYRAKMVQEKLATNILLDKKVGIQYLKLFRREKKELVHIASVMPIQSEDIN